MDNPDLIVDQFPPPLSDADITLASMRLRPMRPRGGSSILLRWFVTYAAEPMS